MPTNGNNNATVTTRVNPFITNLSGFLTARKAELSHGNIRQVMTTETKKLAYSIVSDMRTFETRHIMNTMRNLISMRTIQRIKRELRAS